MGMQVSWFKINQSNALEFMNNFNLTIILIFIPPSANNFKFILKLILMWFYCLLYVNTLWEVHGCHWCPEATKILPTGIQTSLPNLRASELFHRFKRRREQDFKMLVRRPKEEEDKPALCLLQFLICW